MADLCDKASEAFASWNEASLSIVTRRQRGYGPIIDNGKAFCRRCGGEISPARIKALPECETCISCAMGQKHEY